MGRKKKLIERCKISTASATPPSATPTVTAYDKDNNYDMKREDRMIVVYGRNMLGCTCRATFSPTPSLKWRTFDSARFSTVGT